MTLRFLGKPLLRTRMTASAAKPHREYLKLHPLDKGELTGGFDSRAMWWT